MQAGEEQGRQAVEEAVTHGSVVEGPRCSEGRERNAMGEERQDKGSQRKLGQKAEEVPITQPRNTLSCFWRAEVIGGKGQGTAMLPSATWSLQHCRPKETPCKPRQLKYVFDNLECISLTQALLWFAIEQGFNSAVPSSNWTASPTVSYFCCFWSFIFWPWNQPAALYTSILHLYFFAEHAGLALRLNFVIDPCTLMSCLPLQGELSVCWKTPARMQNSQSVLPMGITSSWIIVEEK